MAMEQLLRMLLTIPEVSALVRAVERGECPAAVTLFDIMPNRLFEI